MAGSEGIVTGRDSFGKLNLVMTDMYKHKLEYWPYWSD